MIQAPRVILAIPDQMNSELKLPELVQMVSDEVVYITKI